MDKKFTIIFSTLSTKKHFNSIYHLKQNKIKKMFFQLTFSRAHHKTNNK